MGVPPNQLNIDTSKAFGPAKDGFESTYKRLFEQFTSVTNQANKAIEANNKIFNQMVIIDVKSAHINNDVKGVSGTGLNELAMDVQTNLDNLKYIAQTKKGSDAKLFESMHQKYAGNYDNLKNDVEQKLAQRHTLQKEVQTYIKEIVPKAFAEVDSAIKQGQSAESIQQKIDELKKHQNDLETKIMSLNKGDLYLEMLLKTLKAESHSTVATVMPGGVMMTPDQLKQLKSS